MFRNGYTQVPNHVWDDTRIDGKDIALMTYLDSHITGYIIKGPIARKCVSMSEPTYNSRMQKLAGLGILQKEKAYIDGKVAGIRVTITWPKLNKKNMGPDQAVSKQAEPTKAAHRNDGLLRRLNSKNGAPPPKYDKHRQVIDYQDGATDIEF